MVDIRLKNGPESSLFASIFKEHEIIFTNDTNQVFIQYNNDKILLSNCMIGLLADRPSAGIRSRMYYATDNGNLYLDDGNNWISINGGSNQYVVKEFFINLMDINNFFWWGNSSNSYGNYYVVNGKESVASLYIPNDFDRLLKIDMLCIGMSNPNNKIDIHTYYAHNGQKYNEYAKTLNNINFPTVNKRIHQLDITNCVDTNHLEKNMVLGIKCSSDNDIRYMGIRFVYRGVLSYDL